MYFLFEMAKCTPPFLVTLLLSSLYFSASGEDLDLNNVGEGPCTEVIPAEKIDIQWFKSVSEKGWFLPMLSLGSVANWNQVLTGKALQSLDQLNNFCPRLQTSENCTKLTLTAFDSKATYACTWNPETRAKTCVATSKITEEVTSTSSSILSAEVSDSDAAEDKSDAAASRGPMVISWTDNEKYAIGVRCVSGKRVWGLAARRPYVDLKAKEFVLNHIAGLGFDKKKAYSVQYDDCWKD